MTRAPVTLEDLLWIWKIRQAAYIHQIAQLDPDPVDEIDKARLSIIIAMELQLRKCIEDVESLSLDYPVKDYLESFIRGLRE